MRQLTVRKRLILPPWFAVCAILALAGCAGGDLGKTASSAETPAPAQMIYPDGVVTTSGALHATRGIYAVQAGGEHCCWVDDDVRFAVRTPRKGAKTLGLNVMMPAAAAFGRRQQSVALIDASGKTVATRSVALGTSTTLLFPLPAGVSRGGALPVHLHMGVAVVPHDVGAGPDLRRLAIVITDAFTR